MEVSASGFYEWRERGPSARSQVNAKLLAQIRTFFEASDRTYGSPRIVRDLHAAGEQYSKKRVARLMRIAKLQARRRRQRLPADTGVRPEHRLAPNLLDRQFDAQAPNQRWVADFTYLWTAQGWLFVAVVLDLYSRRVVGWSMSESMSAKFVLDALIMALWRRGKPSQLIHHSDQGIQYTSEDFQRLLSAHGIACSMSRRGDCWDNAAMESFFSSLKTERTSRRRYVSRDEARADVFDYIERFYNPRRRHSKLGYVSPVDYEKGLMG
jgi:putative transposase